jgi:hypothetical protein
MATRPTIMASRVVRERRRLRSRLRRARDTVFMPASFDAGDAPVADEDDLVGLGGAPGVVGREYEGHVLLALHAAHQGDDLGAGVAVEIGGGLVGEHQRRCGGQGAGDGHALALAAGELCRQVALAVRQAHRVQQGLHPLAPLGPPRPPTPADTPRSPGR